MLVMSKSLEELDRMVLEAMVLNNNNQPRVTESTTDSELGSKIMGECPSKHK